MAPRHEAGEGPHDRPAAGEHTIDRKTEWETDPGSAFAAAGYPAKADSAWVNRPLVVAILFRLVMYVTVVYGPMVAATGNNHEGLWYPVVGARVTVVVGFLFIRERKDVDIHA